jgi:hypothetical protein
MARPFYESVFDKVQDDYSYDKGYEWVDKKLNEWWPGDIPGTPNTEVKQLPLKLDQNLQYPLENTHGYGARISFRLRSMDDNAIVPLKDVVDVTGNAPSDTGIEYVTPEEMQILKGGWHTPKVGQIQTDAKRVTLYLPAGLNMSDRVSWTGVAVGAIGAAKRDIVQGIIQRGQLPSWGDVKGAANEQWNKWNPNDTSAAVKAAVLAGASNRGENGLINQGLRITADPNFRTAFEGSAPRVHTFEFKFIATSPEEYREIRSIIYYFRRALYPYSLAMQNESEIGGEELELVYQYPDPFDITVYYLNSKGEVIRDIAPRFKPCQLDTVAVQYNSTSTGMHDDGGFVEIDMTLNFLETVSLNRSDIEITYNATGEIEKGGY